MTTLPSLTHAPFSSPLACAFLRRSSLALADRPRPYQRCGREFPASLRNSLNQHFIRQPLACNPVNQTIQPVESVPLNVAFVESKRELVCVAMNVLGASVMIDAVQAALHHRPNAFNAVGRDAIADVLTVSVVDRRVKEILAELVITGVFVGIDNRTHFHVVVNFTAQRRMARILNRHGLCFAAALPHAEDDRFPGSTTWAGTPRFLV